MRVDLLLVLCLDDEDDRHRYKVSVVIAMRKDELWRRIDGQLGRVLKGM